MDNEMSATRLERTDSKLSH